MNKSKSYKPYKEENNYDLTNFPVNIFTVDEKHPKYEMLPHWHLRTEIIRILEGELIINLDERRYVAHKGDIAFINQSVVHSAKPKNCVYECINYNTEFIPRIHIHSLSFGEELLRGRYIVDEFHNAKNDEFHKCINDLFEAMKKDNNGKGYMVMSCLCRMYSIIINEGKYTSEYSDMLDTTSVVRLRNVLEFIQKSFRTNITLSDMAYVANLSPKYFCRFFKKMTNMSPIDYVKTYRLEHGHHKLIYSNEPISEIALSSGFNDVSYFIKSFKNLYGITPNQLRKNL